MMSPSPVSAGVSRRVALGATSAGVLAALTACASDIRPLADSSPSGELGECVRKRIRERFGIGFVFLF